MPETYGLPEDEDEDEVTIEDRVVEAFAGNGIVRRMVLYLIVAVALTLLAASGRKTGVVAAVLGAIALFMLSFTDKGLSS